MLSRRLLAALAVLAALAMPAWGDIEIHTTSAGSRVASAAHLRTVHGEIARALVGARAAPGHTLDVSLVRLDATVAGASVEVRAELRAVFSDPRGVILWSSTARATARGTPRDRALVERDAVTAAAQQLGQLVRARL